MIRAASARAGACRIRVVGTKSQVFTLPVCAEQPGDSYALQKLSQNRAGAFRILHEVLWECDASPHRFLSSPLYRNREHLRKRHHESSIIAARAAGTKAPPAR